MTEAGSGAALADGRALALRRGAPDDAARVRAYYHEVVQGKNPWYPFPHRASSLDLWLERSGYLDFARNLHWLLEAEGETAAHLMVQRNDIPAIGLEGTASLYLTIAPAARGRGAGEFFADRWASHFVPQLREERVRRVTAHVFAENLASTRLLRRMGFSFEGTLRQHLRARDGRLHDVHLFAQLTWREAPCATCARGTARLRRTFPLTAEPTP